MVQRRFGDGRKRARAVRDEDNKVLRELPEGVRARAEETLIKYEPYVQQVRDYHDKLRNVQDPEPMTPWTGAAAAPAVPVGLSLENEATNEQ